MSSSHVPIALSTENKQPRLASEVSKSDGPFECIGCNEPLILKKGLIKKPHFSHHSKSECKGGESVYHALAKRLVKLHLSSFVFMEVCMSCRCTMYNTNEMEYTFNDEHQAVEEHPVGVYRLDVGVLNEQHRVVAAIEIFHTHRVDDAKHSALQQLSIPVIEVVAEQVLHAYQNNAWLLTFDKKRRCHKCSDALIEKQNEMKRKEFVKHNRKCIHCSRWKPADQCIHTTITPQLFEYAYAYVCHNCTVPCAVCRAMTDPQQVVKHGMCVECEDITTMHYDEGDRLTAPIVIDDDIQLPCNKITNYFTKLS